jgi:general secretion pathway protein F
MPTFRYSAYRADGSAVSGSLDAGSPADAQSRLKQQGLLLKELAADVSTTRGFWRRQRVGVAELALVTRRLATLIGAAVPVHEAVTALHDQEQPGELQQILGRVRQRLAEGAGLSRALAAEPAVFGENYVAMVAAGEASGALETVLERLAQFLEDQEALRSSLVTALAYPLLMTVVGGGVMGFLLTFVVPRIVAVFAESKASLPLITVALITVSRFFQHWWWALLLALVILLLGGRRLLAEEKWQYKRDRFLLRLPHFGGLVQRLALARCSRVLGLLLASGVPLVQALEISGAVTANRVFQADLDQVRDEVVQGRSLAASLGGSPLFPPMLVHMVAVGERSGQLEAMLVKAGTAFATEFEAAMKRLMSLMEPLLVLAMGLAVGLVVVAVLLPIFELNQLIK